MFLLSAGNASLACGYEDMLCTRYYAQNPYFFAKVRIFSFKNKKPPVRIFPYGRFNGPQFTCEFCNGGKSGFGSLTWCDQESIM
jgi:hypothetical protein